VSLALESVETIPAGAGWAEVEPPQDNPLYPLPIHYHELGGDEQRLARLRAVANQETPDDLVWAWSFFRTRYLRQTPPGFFYKRWKPSPGFHYDMVRDVGRYARNGISMWRWC
jgi:hypothetical protein